jgi:hypothetical protein
VTRLRPLSEEECYVRLYGDRDDSVSVIREERQPRGLARISGEDLRRLFEDRLEARDPEELLEPEAA